MEGTVPVSASAKRRPIARSLAAVSMEVCVFRNLVSSAFLGTGISQLYGGLRLPAGVSGHRCECRLREDDREYFIERVFRGSEPIVEYAAQTSHAVKN